MLTIRLKVKAYYWLSRQFVDISTWGGDLSIWKVIIIVIVIVIIIELYFLLWSARHWCDSLNGLGSIILGRVESNLGAIKSGVFYSLVLCKWFLLKIWLFASIFAFIILWLLFSVELLISIQICQAIAYYCLNTV